MLLISLKNCTCPQYLEKPTFLPRTYQSRPKWTWHNSLRLRHFHPGSSRVKVKNRPALYYKLAINKNKTDRKFSRGSIFCQKCWVDRIQTFCGKVLIPSQPLAETKEARLAGQAASLSDFLLIHQLRAGRQADALWKKDSKEECSVLWSPRLPGLPSSPAFETMCFPLSKIIFTHKGSIELFFY